MTMRGDVLKPAPSTLQIAVRGYCIRDPKHLDEAVATKTYGRPKPRPGRFICLAPPPPGIGGPLVMVALAGRPTDFRLSHEVFAYRDEASEAEIEAIRQYAAAHGQQTRVSVIPLSEFRKWFFSLAYKKQNLVVGFDLPYAISRIATRWMEVKKGERFVKGWKLEILPGRDGKWGPSIVVKATHGSATFIEFRQCGGADSSEEQGSENEDEHHYPHGQFLDLRALAYALSVDWHTLESALAAFTDDATFTDEAPHCDAGPVWQQAVDLHQRAYATKRLAKTLLHLFDRYPVSRGHEGGQGRLGETKVYSPAGIHGAIARHIDFDRPDMPRNRIGPSSAACFGGQVDVAALGYVPSLWSTDFSKQYATIAALIRLQDFLRADHLDFVEATDEVRDFAARCGTADLLRDPVGLFPQLAVLCWVRLRGEIVPVRAWFDGHSFSMGVVPRSGSDPSKLVPLMLPDVIAAKERSGRLPEIVRAERIVPKDLRPLRQLKLPSGVWLDLDNPYRSLVEEGERLKRGLGAWAKVPASVRAVLYRGWKAGNNMLAYGALARTDLMDLPGNKKEEVTLLYDEGECRARLRHPENPGPLNCPPLAALVPACGRLLLAIVHRLVEDKGGFIAMGDTDSAHIVTTKTGGSVRVKQSAGGITEAHAWKMEDVHTLSDAEVDEIASRFGPPFNPFDPELMPGSLLKINYRGVRALIIAEKRYKLMGPDVGDTVDAKASILAMYLSPLPPPATAEDFIIAAWQHIDDLWDGLKPKDSRPWLQHPAVRPMWATRPAYFDRVKSVAPRPFDPFLAARVIRHGKHVPGEDRGTAIAVAPYETNPAKWASLPWVFEHDGQPVPLAEKRGWRLFTIGEMLDQYVKHRPHDFVDAAGARCRADTRGILQRRPIRDGEKWITTKESLGWSNDPALAFQVQRPEMVCPGRGRASSPSESCDWEAARAALAVVGPAAVAQRLGLDARNPRRWLDGTRLPANPYQTAVAIAQCASRMGLGLPSDDELGVDAICSALPRRAAEAQCFISVAVVLLAQHQGGLRKLAEAMTGKPAAGLGPAVDESSIRRWLALAKGPLRPIGETNAILAKLAQFARRLIREKKRRSPSVDAGPAGNRQIIVACLSLLYGVKEFVVLEKMETLELPAALLLAALLFAMGPLFLIGVLGKLTPTPQDTKLAPTAVAEAAE
jgi:hypothetical protein